MARFVTIEDVVKWMRLRSDSIEMLSHWGGDGLDITDELATCLETGDWQKELNDMEKDATKSSETR